MNRGVLTTLMSPDVIIGLIRFIYVIALSAATVWCINFIRWSKYTLRLRVLMTLFVCLCFGIMAVAERTITASVLVSLFFFMGWIPWR